MTKLTGFQCNNPPCQVRSRDKPGTWLEVSTMRVDSEGDWHNTSLFRSEGLHYCSRKCLIEHSEKWDLRR